MTEKRTQYDKELVDIYEAGKGRRYGLLFSANGGAYAIAVYLASLGHTVAGYSFDGAGLIVLALFMIAFNWMMWQDIYAFGDRMHKLDSRIRGVPAGEEWLLFGPVGRRVLNVFGIGLILGWICVLVGGAIAVFLGFDASPAAPATP